VGEYVDSITNIMEAIDDSDGEELAEDDTDTEGKLPVIQLHSIGSSSFPPCHLSILPFPRYQLHQAQIS
jgi:hypothetical protein